MFRDPWVLVLLLAALATRLVFLPERTLWFDEAYSVAVARQPLADIWGLVTLDVHPPLYYWVLHLWINLFGDSLWAIRGLSVAAGVGAVALAAGWLHTFAPLRAVRIALALLVIQPIAVRYSQEARMYALLGLWLMAASWTLAGWQHKPGPWRYPLVYAGLAAAALYTHYFALLGLSSHWTWVAFTRRGRSRLLGRRDWWLANGVAAALFAPWLPSLFQQLNANRGLDWILPLDSGTVPTALWEFIWAGSPWSLWPVLGLVMPALLTWAIWQTRATSLGSQRTAVMLLALLPIALAALVSVFKPVFVTRYLSFAALPMTLLLAMAIDTLSRSRPRAASMVFVALAGVQCVGVHNAWQGGGVLDGPHATLNGTGPLSAIANEQWRVGDEAVSDGANYFGLLYYLRHHPQPWLRVDGKPPTFTGAFATLSRGTRSPWLPSYADLPAATCGLWVFAVATDPQRYPPPDQWALAFQEQADATLLHYYRRRSCAQPSTAQMPASGNQTLGP
ncbi:glycosyltransferase family 39 protein [Pseudomonas sp. dw_358]|uniref:glycosyltransferase family 39 protein n=1 Tax=Pseudomonas sp. dw_358 TaxID=2720083 RepID=UPI001BD4147E|nr:glycosyltransferase family 39 protein [Pseudomonas sp. dw_358]